MNTAATGILVGRDAAAQRRVALARKNGRIADAAAGKTTKQDDKKLRKVCMEMESLFVKQMLSTMRKTVHKSGFIDGGNAERIFTDMLDSKYAMKMSKSHSFGLAGMMYSQLSRGRRW